MLILITLVAVAIAVLLLAVGIIAKPSGKFPNTHVGGNEALRAKGIGCHTSQHREAQAKRSLSERLQDAEARG